MRTLLLANSAQASSFVLQRTVFSEPLSPWQLANLLQRVHGLPFVSVTPLGPQTLSNSCRRLPVIEYQLVSKARAEIDELHGLLTVAVGVLVPTINLIRVRDVHALQSRDDAPPPMHRSLLILQPQRALPQIVVLVDGTEAVDHLRYVLGARDGAVLRDDLVAAGLIR